MLYVITGGEAQERAALRKKIWEEALEELEPTLPLEELAALSGTPTLTNEGRGYVLRGAFTAEEDSTAVKDRTKALLAIAPSLANSVHTFLFEEEKLPAKTMTALGAEGAALEELPSHRSGKAPFNVFALADALGRRDRKTLWLLLVRAGREGIAPENTAGVLAWKARTMLAFARTPRERESLRALSRELVSLYHDSRRGAGGLDLLLERFALTL